MTEKTVTVNTPLAKTFGWLHVNGTHLPVAESAPEKRLAIACGDEKILILNEAVRLKAELEDNAVFRLIQVRYAEEESRAVNDIQVTCGKDAVFEWYRVILGGRATYDNCSVTLAGAGSRFEANIGYRLEGEDIAARKDNALAELRNKYIGFIFQSFYLMPGMNALENVALPLMYAGISKRERLERAREALRGVGLEDRMKFLPNQLSGGQCQRVAIARAMAGKPALLLADEPTGALDTASGEQIMDLFDQINAEGSTIIMITHEASIAARAKTVCHIRDGRLSVPGEEAL